MRLLSLLTAISVLGVTKQKGYKKFTEQKLLNQNLKTMLSLGGAKCQGSCPNDKLSYSLLVKELQQELIKEANRTGNTRLLLSMVIPASSAYIQKGYEIPVLNENLDFFNVLAYDYHLSTGAFVYHHLPLYPTEEDLQNPLNSVLNVICQDIKVNGWKVVNATAEMGPYAYYDNLWVGYDDPVSVTRKGEYASMMGLGGLMFWTIDDDFRGKCQVEKYPLILAGTRGIVGSRKTLPTPKTPSKTMISITSQRQTIRVKNISSSVAVATPNTLSVPSPAIVAPKQPTNIGSFFPNGIVPPISPDTVPAFPPGIVQALPSAFASSQSSFGTRLNSSWSSMGFPSNLFFQDIKIWVTNHFYYSGK